MSIENKSHDDENTSFSYFFITFSRFFFNNKANQMCHGTTKLIIFDLLAIGLNEKVKIC